MDKAKITLQVHQALLLILLLQNLLLKMTYHPSYQHKTKTVYYFIQLLSLIGYIISIG